MVTRQPSAQKAEDQLRERRRRDIAAGQRELRAQRIAVGQQDEGDVPVRQLQQQRR